MKKTSCIALALILSFGILGLAKSSLASGNTYYVCDTGTACGSGWSTGNDVNACTTKGAPCKTIRGGIGKMSGTGNTVIIGDGTYIGTNNMMGGSPGGNPWSGIPSGVAGAYNKIMAENYLGAVINGQGTTMPLWVSGNYLQFEGLHIKNSPEGNIRIDGNYCRVFSCASEEAGSAHVGLYGQYNVAEDVFGWGRTTYAFWNGVDHNVFRRCVVRKDAHNERSGGNWYGSWCAYRSTYSDFQNCISIDSEYHAGGAAETSQYNGTIFTANGDSDPFYVDGSISINDGDKYFLWRDEVGTSYYLNNVVVIPANATGLNGGDGKSRGVYGANSTYLTNFLIKNAATGIAPSGDGSFNGNVTNSIITGNTTGMSSQFTGTHIYNIFNNITDLLGLSFSTGELKHATGTSDGLKYPVRIEDNSYLKTAGAGGSQVGPTILYRIGRNTTTSYGSPISGLYWGQDGWNETQDGQSGRALAKLWPFPNENKIKELMSTYNLYGVNGARGFCFGTSKDGSPQTLTKYIWEYLGNQIPADIYGGSTSTVLYGDASGDGSISAYDASLAAQYAVSLITLTSNQITAADVSGDGTVSAYDASLIAQKAVGLITKFPVEGG